MTPIVVGLAVLGMVFALGCATGGNLAWRGGKTRGAEQALASATRRGIFRPGAHWHLQEILDEVAKQPKQMDEGWSL